MNRNLLMLIVFLISGLTMIAQEESDNICPNGDFEDTKTKVLKNYGQLEELCEDWFQATNTPGDIFSTVVKGDKVGAPKNAYGYQDPLSGDCYAGFRAYTKDQKKSRSYLQVKLSKPLEKNQQYSLVALG